MQAGYIGIVSGPGSKDRINEDGWLALEASEGCIVCAVIDGASVRIGLPSLTAYLHEQHGIENPAVWATNTVRKSFCSQLNAKPQKRLEEVLKRTNESLRSSLKELPTFKEIFDLLEHRPLISFPQILQECTELLRDELQPAFMRAFPDGSWRQLDIRHLRLVLPVCVATAIRLKLGSGSFDFVHVGDTALVRVDAAGNPHLMTQDQMGKVDDAVLEIAVGALHELQSDIEGVVGAFREVSAVRQANLLNGVRHNYVTRNGRTQPEAGCGVINGLPELDDYIQTGNGLLATGERLYLMSDGLMLPMSRHDRKALSPDIIDTLAQFDCALKGGEVTKLYEAVRVIEGMDPMGTIFPRLKQRDDATGIVISK